MEENVTDEEKSQLVTAESCFRMQEVGRYMREGEETDTMRKSIVHALLEI